MASPVMTDVSWAKGKCSCYHLCGDSFKFSGFMHPPGRAIKKANTGTPKSSSMVFIPCRNRNRGRPMFSPCALSLKIFKSIRPNNEIVCKLVLMLGLSFNPKSTKFYYHYIEWNDNLYGYPTLAEAMECLKVPMAFIRAMFEHEVSVTCIFNFHVRFLNQVCGPSLPSWTHSPVIAKRNGLYFHEMMSAPDLWSASWVKHIKRPNLIDGPTSPCCISNVVYSKHASELARLTKTKRLIQFKNAKTMDREPIGLIKLITR